MNSNSAKSFVRNIALHEFEQSFGELIQNKSNFFAYFYGGYDQNGVSWCSDCVISKPNIEEASKALEEAGNVFLVKLPIDDRVEWKKPEFVYRTHEKVKVTRVPTLIYYHKGIEFGRLVEDQLYDLENVKEFFNQSLEI
jgi:hypothetical protein